MVIARKPQLSYTDELIEDEALVGALEQWHDALTPYQQSYRALDKEVKGTIEAKELEPGEYRAGRFVIRISENESKYVEFERKSGRAVRIRAQKDEDD